MAVEAVAGDVFQGEVRLSLVLVDLVHLDDVEVVEGGDGPGLGGEPGAVLGGGLGAGEDHFQGDAAVQVDVEGTLVGRFW